MKILLAATALMLSMTATANAAEPPKASNVVAGGPIFAQTEDRLYCEFTNVGTTNVTPISQQVFAEGLGEVSSTSNCTNGTAVAPSQACVISPTGPISFDFLSCEVTFSGAAKNVRGALQIYDTSYNPLATVELR